MFQTEVYVRTNANLASVILADATVAHAQQLAVQARAAQVAREQADIETARIDAAQRADNRRMQRSAFLRRVRGQGFSLMFVSVPLWVLTPVVGSILTVFSDNITQTVFLSGDSGATSGSGPGTLYGLLAKLLIAMIVCLVGLAFVFPYPDGEEVISSAGIGGFALGALLLFYQALAGSGSAASWWWPPLFAVAGHLVFGGIKMSGATGAEAEPFARMRI